jgi:hypothetical protein
MGHLRLHFIRNAEMVRRFSAFHLADAAAELAIHAFAAAQI